MVICGQLSSSLSWAVMLWALVVVHVGVMWVSRGASVVAGGCLWAVVVVVVTGW